MKRHVVWAKMLPEHVRMPSGKCYVARAVLFDRIGFGPHECFWCYTEIDWLRKEEPAALQVDHLDCDPLNDDPSNLVAVCRRCNSARGKGVLFYILLLLEESGQRTNLDQALSWGPLKHCFDCGHDFEPGNIYHLAPNAHSKFSCLDCRRRKARTSSLARRTSLR